MKKISNIFFYILIVVSTSVATFFILDMISDHPIRFDIFQNTPKTDRSINTTVDQELEEFIQDIDKHNAPIDYNYELEEFCKSDYNICSIINITDKTKQLTSKSIYYYHLIAAYILKKIGSYGYGNIGTNLQSININSKVNKTRGYASAHTITLNIGLMLSYSEFFHVLTHEFGHTFDLGYIVGNSRSLDSRYTEFGRKVFSVDDPSIGFYSISRDDEHTLSSDSSYKDFVSGYGMTDVFEDFAETYNFYLNYHDIFASLSSQSPKLRAKYDYMKKLFNDQFFKSGSDKSSYFENRDFRPYDTTRF